MEFSVPKKKFPLNQEDYTLYEEVGQGVSATVYRALCIPLDEVVAIKVIDLEKCNNDMDMIRREVQTMILLDHPNLLKAHCSFSATTSLWIVMPYMAAGSCLHIIKSAYSNGFEEHTIVTLLHGVIQALAYLHSHGHIHRDVKAGNILVNSKGAVKLADFGVSTSLFDSGNRLQSKKTFVGTPCWMAPEVMQQLHGYDFKADIWSFGITALELAHGHAPFSKYPPMKVLLMTLQNAPPGLDYERDKRFSKSFKELVAACLVKDPKKRPTAEKLLKHHFFKHARSNEFIVRTILDDLCPLGDRFRMLKEKEAELFAQNAALYADEHLSQQKYIRGISAWNFDLEDLRRQASLIQDDDGSTLAEDQDWICKQKGKGDIKVDLLRSTWNNEDFKKLEEPFDSSKLREGEKSSYFEVDNLERSCSMPRNIYAEAPKIHSSGPFKINYSSGDKRSDQLTHQQESDDNSCLHETALDELGIQYTGQSKVGVPDSSPKEIPKSCTRPYLGESVDSVNGPAAFVVPALQCILQQNATQMEETMKLIGVVDQITGKHTEFTEAVTVLTSKKKTQLSLASAREKVLEAHVSSIEKRIEKLIGQLHIEKMKNAKLVRLLSQVDIE